MRLLVPLPPLSFSLSSILTGSAGSSAISLAITRMSESPPTDTSQKDVKGPSPTSLLLSPPGSPHERVNDDASSPGTPHSLRSHDAAADILQSFSSNVSLAELPSLSPPIIASTPSSLTSSASLTPSGHQYNVYPNYAPHLMEPSLDPPSQSNQNASSPYSHSISSGSDMSALGRTQNIPSPQEDGDAGYIPDDSDNKSQQQLPQLPHNPYYFFTPTPPLHQPPVHAHQNLVNNQLGLGFHSRFTPVVPHPPIQHPTPPNPGPFAPPAGTVPRGQQAPSQPKPPGVRIVHADDYEQRYPEDPSGSECGPMARIWRIFLDECQEFDAGRIDILQDSVDVLLVFAGLFSAAVSTFVAQTSQSLQTDYTKISAYLLYEAVSIQRAIATGAVVSSIPVSPLNPTTTFVASTSDRWVNGLWFASLSLSLITALVAVLAKQWIRQHMLASSGTPRDRARIRQFRYMGFEEWHVPVIIGILPSLLHMSLTIFLVGLVIFLVALERPIAYVMLAITGGSYVLELLRWTPKEQDTQYPPSIRELELQTIKSQSDSLDVQSLRWLYTISSNPTVHSCVIQSIGGLQLSVNSEELDTSFQAIY
ncbi:uncharacterized protein BT62DRAFT_57133 [Guyanagaster necrorhizus]|uniref:DUF6535 domain-containing protein n=1 Tax=Guyanagaster necrorhizus TaxID=856835 RepID=A0A9P7W636_9AGAR|nr:uncharacterized protein BT62DRAFT_57133 [Guyanagaster necrorhizus MCA 3950]KAG7453272.1 hypothetical protein BT62DRAFT_57133 [Guyanagaster necrorhizus MCA 3950]